VTGGAGDRPLRAYQDIHTAWERLAEYLREEFRPDLTDYTACCAFVEEEFARHGPVDFYRLSRGYLYELTHFHFTPYKDSFFQMVVCFAQAHGLTDLGDVGCGVGLDAQALMSAGFTVTLYDLQCPSLDYAAWRLERDLGAGDVARTLDDLDGERHDLVYAVDVLEHLAEPAAFVDRLFAAGDHVAVNLFAHSRHPWDGRDMHFPQDHWSLLPVFTRQADLVQVAVSGETVCTLWRRRARETSR